jgi:hypothetical protein
VRYHAPPLTGKDDTRVILYVSFPRCLRRGLPLASRSRTATRAAAPAAAPTPQEA